jgi:hypothetical protein
LEAQLKDAKADAESWDEQCDDARTLALQQAERAEKAEAREAEALRDVAQLHDAAVETEAKLEGMKAREAALREAPVAPERWPDGQYTTVMERQMYMMGYDAIRPAEQQEVADLRRKLEEARHDISVYRGALGYGVPGDISDMLTDGTQPVCGMCGPKEREIASIALANAALRQSAQMLWDAVAHDVTDESRWVGTAMAKVQAALALPADSLAQEVVWLLDNVRAIQCSDKSEDWWTRRNAMLSRLGVKP